MNESTQPQLIQPPEVLSNMVSFSFAFQKAFFYINPMLSTLGAVGAALALTTMFRSKSLSTPSFVYHKSLVFAQLIFCVNNLLTILLTTQAVGATKQLYTTWIQTYYHAVLSRVVTSTCGYLELYSVVLITLDRLLALRFGMTFYQKFNKQQIARILVAVSTVLSFALHSWTEWIDTVVIEIKMGNDTRYQKVEVDSKALTESARTGILVKDFYNGAIRLTYPVLLTALTVCSIVLFARHMRRRAALQNKSRQRRDSKQQRTQRRRDRFLFLLMIVVVVLAFIQVIPTESVRLSNLIQPQEALFARIKQLPRGSDEYWSISIHFYLTQIILKNNISQLCVVVDRSLLFYINFALNASFRKACLQTFSCLCPRALKLQLQKQKTASINECTTLQTGKTGQPNRSTTMESHSVIAEHSFNHLSNNQLCLALESERAVTTVSDASYVSPQNDSEPLLKLQNSRSHSPIKENSANNLAVSFADFSKQMYLCENYQPEQRTKVQKTLTLDDCTVRDKSVKREQLSPCDLVDETLSPAKRSSQLSKVAATEEAFEMSAEEVYKNSVEEVSKNYVEKVCKPSAEVCKPSAEEFYKISVEEVYKNSAAEIFENCSVEFFNEEPTVSLHSPVIPRDTDVLL